MRVPASGPERTAAQAEAMQRTLLEQEREARLGQRQTAPARVSEWTRPTDDEATAEDEADDAAFEAALAQTEHALEAARWATPNEETPNSGT